MNKKYAWDQRGNKRAIQVSWHKNDGGSFTTTVYEYINYINNLWLLFFPIHLIVYWFFLAINEWAKVFYKL